MSFGLAVLGCGSFAATFAGALTPLRRDLDLYFASRASARAREYARRFGGAGAFGSYSEAVSDPRVQAVYVCTPHHLHREHAELAAQAGKHVLLEKPIARTLEEAEGIIRASRASSVTLMVAENYHYLPQVGKCKELVDQGAIGGVRLVQVQEEAPFRPGGWRRDAALSGGGVLIDGGIHKVHFLRQLLGEPSRIYAAQLSPNLPGHQGEDGVVATLSWDYGPVGLINHAWTGSQRPSPHWAAVSGDRGRICFELDATVMRLERNGHEETLVVPADRGGLVGMVREFMACIRENRGPETTGESGLADLRIVLAAYDSMRRGVAVSLS